MRIIQFSDTHISHLGGVGYANAERLVDYLNEVAAPELAINTGDVVILDPDAADDRDAAIRIHERIQAPLRVLPGNHDVGECARDPWRGLGVTSERVQAFRSAWRTHVARRVLIELDQLLHEFDVVTFVEQARPGYIVALEIFELRGHADPLMTEARKFAGAVGGKR